MTLERFDRYVGWAEKADGDSGLDRRTALLAKVRELLGI